MAPRRKTTMYIDERLLRATKVAAAREDKTEYQVVEEALRTHLGFDVIDRMRSRMNLSEDEAMALATSEVKAHRREEATRAKAAKAPTKK